MVKPSPQLRETVQSTEDESLRSLIEHVPIGVFRTTPNGRITMANQALLRLLGLASRRDLDGLDIARDLYTAEYPRERVLQQIERVGHAEGLEFQLRRRDGSLIWVREYTRAVRDKQGATLYYEGTLEDVTARRLAESQLKDREEHLRNIIEHSSNLFYAHTPNHVLTYLSPQTRTFLDCEPEEALVRWTEFASDHPVNVLGLEHTNRAIETGERQPPYELELVGRQGRRLWVEVSEAPVVQDGRTVAIVGALTDITDRKRAEAALREQTQLYENLLKAQSEMGDGVTITEGTRIIYANDALCKMYGYTREEILAMGSFLDLIVPEERAQLVEKLRRRLSGEALPDRGETMLIRKDGRRINIEYSVKVMKNGDRTQFFSIVRDVTQRKIAEGALRDSEARWRAVVENAPDYVMTLDRDGRIRFANRAPPGYERDKLIGTSFYHLASAGDRAWLREQIEDVFQSARPTQYEIKYERPKGGTAWFACRVGPVMHGPEVAAVTVISNDVTPEKIAEESLKGALSVLTATLESTADGILVVDKEGRIASHNHKFAQMWRIPYDVLASRNDAKAMASVLDQLSDAEGFVRKVKELYAEPDAESYDVLEFKDGRVFERYSIPQTVGGEVVGRVWSFRDVTKRRRAELEVRALNEQLEMRVHQRTTELEAANAELEAFSSSVSHDLRAPLRTINGFSQALIEDYGDRLDDEGRYLLDRIQAATRHMADLIDDLLRLSRVTRSKFERRTVDLSTLAQTIMDALRQQVPRRRLDFVVQDGMKAHGDPDLLRVVLENLLSNAWKFTSKKPAARVEFTASPNGGKTVYMIRDDGAGFDMRHVHRLFTPFERLHKITDFEGTGIGLATVQRIIQRHGGRVWAEGAVGKGATLYFTL